jgi:hypothetical protein
MSKYDYQRANCQEPTCRPGACTQGWEIVDTTDGQVLALRRSVKEARKLARQLNAEEEPNPGVESFGVRDGG